MEAPRSPGWDGVEVKLAALFADASLDPGTRDQIGSFLNTFGAQCEPPDHVGKAYWGTVCLSWPGLEVEVFPNRYELYCFHEGSTDIWEFFRSPGELIPKQMIDLFLELRCG